MAKRIDKVPFTFLVMELLFVIVFLLFLFIEVIQTRVQPFTLTFSSEGFDYFILIILGLLAVFFHLLLIKRFPETARIQKEVTQFYKLKTKEKVAHARQDFRVMAGLMIEFVLIITVALGLYGIIDEKIPLLQKDIPWAGKALAVGLLLVLAVYMYLRFSKPFRELGAYYIIGRRWRPEKIARARKVKAKKKTRKKAKTKKVKRRKK